ncbi:MAG: hypothetical protein ACYC3O_07725 [Burkholderiales bacterium]
MSTQEMEFLLSRLQKVVKKGQNSWRALCPCHNDHNPSLVVKIGLTGSPIIKCPSCGAGAAVVLDALGLDYGCLYPRRPAPHGKRGPQRYFFPNDIFEDVKDIIQLTFFYQKSGDQEGILRLAERLQAIDSFYHFETRQTPGKAQEWGDDYE